MYYYIDGYNLLFHFLEPKQNLKTLRNQVIAYLQKRFASLHWEGTVVFDGAHNKEEEGGLTYPSPLIIAYTPKGQTADEYIVEQLNRSKKRRNETVVTNDRTLILHARSMGAHVLSNQLFIEKLKKKRKKSGTVKEPQETNHQIERLNQIFEKRLREDSGE